MPPAICPFASPSISNAPSNSCSSRLKLGRAAPARKSEVFHFLPNSLHLARTGHKQRLVSVVTIQCDPLSLKKLASAFPVAVAVRARTSSYNSEPPSITPRCRSQREVIMKSSKPGSNVGRCLSDKARLSGRRCGPSEQTTRCCRGERRAGARHRRRRYPQSWPHSGHCR
jgi:hypothetical protein